MKEKKGEGEVTDVSQPSTSFITEIRTVRRLHSIRIIPTVRSSVNIEMPLHLLHPISHDSLRQWHFPFDFCDLHHRTTLVPASASQFVRFTPLLSSHKRAEGRREGPTVTLKLGRTYLTYSQPRLRKRKEREKKEDVVPGVKI